MSATTIFQSSSEVLAYTKDGLKITDTAVPAISTPAQEQVALLG